jgi:hypothetical protein
VATTAEIKAVLKMRVDGEKQLKAVAPQLRKASAGMKDFGKASELSSAKVAKTTRSLGDLKLQYIAVAAAVAVGVRMIRGALEAQSEQEAAINKLNLALSNQGNLLPGVSERLQEYAAGLQQITTFGDETILQGQALLATFGMNEEQLKATTEVALDFAAATGRDLTMAINLLGKAFVGETGELSRYGIVIDENIPKNERFAEVMKQLNERFGGQAQATVATFSGKLQQFKNAAGDAQEGLGFFIGQLLDFGSAGGVGIGVMDRIGKVFREDFVLALGLARKAFTSWTC